MYFGFTLIYVQSVEVSVCNQFYICKFFFVSIINFQGKKILHKITLNVYLTSTRFFIRLTPPFRFCVIWSS